MKARHKYARFLLCIGAMAWIPFIILKYIMHIEVAMEPYLAVHLFGVIPGTLLRRGPETQRWLKHLFFKKVDRE